MGRGFIEAHIARGNRNLLGLGLGLCLAGGGLAALFWHWFPALLLAPGLAALTVWLARALRPAAHPLYRRLADYGDVRQLVPQIDREFAGAPLGDRTLFGAAWLAQSDFYGLDLVPWREIARLKIERRRYSQISWYYIRVWARGGAQLIVPAGSWPNQAQATLRELHARAPQAEVG